MRRLAKYFKMYLKEIILAPTVKLIETITELIIPLIIAKMIDVGVAGKDINYLLWCGAIVLGLNVIGLVSALICQKFAARASVGLATNLRSDLFKHICTFSHVEIDRYSTATLNNRLTHDVTRIQQAFGMIVRMVTRTPFLLIGSAIMAAIIDWKLSLIFLVVAPLVVLVVFVILKATNPLYDKTQKNLDKVSDITRENLQGVRVIRSFNKQQYEEARFEVAAKNLCSSSIKVSTVSTLLTPFTSTIINFAIVAVLWFGGVQVNIGELTQGNIIAFINYLTQISMALVSIANIIVALIKAVNCNKRISEVFNTAPSIVSVVPANAEIMSNAIAEQSSTVGTGEVINVTEAEKLSTAKKEIPLAVEFKKASFQYGNASKLAVKDLTLKAKRGETIGIIGGTGSGKSSVVYLIPRFYDATTGKVFVNGKDVKEYNVTDLRNLIGVVPQRAVLFTGSLRENLQWQKQNATDEEIWKALKVAQAEEFVKELDGRLDYKVQAGGKNFSGGQRQRLTIARALVGDPDILILDDSASALDFATDAALRAAIKTNTKTMTTFIVSQRVNSVKKANQIVVLDKGNIVGIGKHGELMKNCAVYSEINDSQTK